MREGSVLRIKEQAILIVEQAHSSKIERGDL